MTLRAMKHLRHLGREYQPDDELPSDTMEAHIVEKLRRIGWVGEGRVRQRREELTVVENPEAKNDPRGQWIGPKESHAEREARERQSQK